jgi:Protein of unknown function (DUF2442)
MPTSMTDGHAIRALDVKVTTDALRVDLVDGRKLVVPLAWYPRLAQGTRRERSHWRLIDRGEGIHWPELDEDISVEGLLAGRRSGESRESLKRWLKSRSSIRLRKRTPAVTTRTRRG